jgi:glycosyltransferase involved in cell wall biosynthesis
LVRGTAGAAGQAGGIAPTVSVALCTYNGARFVGEQLASILSQTRPPMQLVISDDGSTDGTVAVARTAIAHAISKDGDLASLEVVYLENAQPLGVTKNFQQALEACTGELIALSDQDDVWVDGKLNDLVLLMESTPKADLAFSDAQLVAEDGTALGTRLFEALRVSPAMLTSIRRGGAFGLLVKRNIVTGATIMVRKSLVQRALPFPESWVHDEWLAIVAAMCGRVACSAHELIRYRQHSSNVIGAQKLSMRSALSRFGQSRAERNGRLLTRANDAYQFAVALVGNESFATALKDKRDHELIRSSYSSKRRTRLKPILREWRTGRYVTYGLGIADALRDAVQPE